MVVAATAINPAELRNVALPMEELHIVSSARNIHAKHIRRLMNMTLLLRTDGENFFCVAVNLLELSELQEGIKQIQDNDALSALPFKAQCQYVAEVFQKIADKRNITLKLMRKK